MAACPHHRILADGAWFRDLPDDIAEAMIAAAAVQAFDAGETVHRQGDASEALYAVLEGAVKVSTLSKDGRECAFRHLLPGSWFGEIGVLDGLPRTHDAVALRPTRLLVLPSDRLAALLERFPILHKFLALLLCRVVRTAFTMLDDTALLPVSARLAKRLVSFAEGYGAASVRLTQDELAPSANASRQTVNKCLADWQKLGWIELRYGGIAIRNLDALRQISLGA